MLTEMDGGAAQTGQNQLECDTTPTTENNDTCSAGHQGNQTIHQLFSSDHESDSSEEHLRNLTVPNKTIRAIQDLLKYTCRNRKRDLHYHEQRVLANLEALANRPKVSDSPLGAVCDELVDLVEVANEVEVGLDAEVTKAIQYVTGESEFQDILVYYQTMM